VNNPQLTSDYVFTLSAWYAFGNSPASGKPLATRPQDIATSDKPDIATISLGEAIKLEDFLVPNKVTLFEFYSDTCLSCEALEPMLRDLVKSSSDVALRKVNIGTGNSPVVQQYQITATPEIRIFDQHGQFIETVVGPEIGSIRSAIAKARHPKLSTELFK
jgi:thiol-disulfide isomerase/thioredoxin